MVFFIYYKIRTEILCADADELYNCDIAYVQQLVDLLAMCIKQMTNRFSWYCHLIVYHLVEMIMILTMNEPLMSFAQYVVSFFTFQCIKSSS